MASEELIVKPSVVLEPVVTQDAITVGVSSRALLLTGEGPPTSLIGSNVGDEYLDTVSGILYKLYPDGV